MKPEELESAMSVILHHIASNSLLFGLELHYVSARACLCVCQAETGLVNMSGAGRGSAAAVVRESCQKAQESAGPANTNTLRCV